MQYDRYRFGLKETLMYIGIWGIVSAVFAWFFYRSAAAIFIFLLFLPLFLSVMKKRCMSRRRWRLKSQFADALQGISTALQAGNSIENAVRKTYYEMNRLHGENADITREFYTILKGLDNNLTLEVMLEDFAKRCAVEEIMDFADIFIVGKRTGGNLREMITSCCNTISDRVEMQREFRIQLASKQLELRIMSLVPFGILLYIGSTSRGYFDNLYLGFQGRAVMSICMLFYVAAFYWGTRIIEKTQEQ